MALSHASGPAKDIPSLLTRAAHDVRPGYQQDSTWFDLWSALCHQDDIYTASYAAVPHLIALAAGHLQRRNYDPLLLSASIELARLEGRGPEIPSDSPIERILSTRSPDLTYATLPSQNARRSSSHAMNAVASLPIGSGSSVS
jgi:hypothetical protein